MNRFIRLDTDQIRQESIFQGDLADILNEIEHGVILLRGGSSSGYRYIRDGINRLDKLGGNGHETTSDKY